MENIEQALIDRGQLIEAGWVGLKIAAISPDAGEVQLREMRMAFFAGAQHLFGSIMKMLEPGAEPTDKDLARMSMIQSELDAFLVEFKKATGFHEGESKQVIS